MHFSQSGSLQIDAAAKAARSILPRLSLATPREQKNFSLAIKKVICRPAQSHFHEAIKAHRDCVLLISSPVRQKRVVCVSVCVFPRERLTHSVFKKIDFLVMQQMLFVLLFNFFREEGAT